MLESDRSRKANRRDVQSICRIQESICQSYFIFDYPDFDVARGFYYEGLAALKDIKSTRVKKFSELLKNTEHIELPEEENENALTKKLKAIKQMNRMRRRASTKQLPPPKARKSLRNQEET